jgi:hypothetical protein
VRHIRITLMPWPFWSPQMLVSMRRRLRGLVQFIGGWRTEDIRRAAEDAQGLTPTWPIWTDMCLSRSRARAGRASKVGAKVRLPSKGFVPAGVAPETACAQRWT